MKQTPQKRIRQIAALLCLALGLAGCGKSFANNSPTHALRQRNASATPKPPTPAQLTKAKVNEAGLVPILEYHEIGPGKLSTVRSVAKFRADLKRLHKENYVPVALADYLNNRIAVPMGKSPVILTFDDARPGQFRYLPDGKIDPRCAVGILLDFHKRHPDFPAKAVFYVLPKRAFGQPRFAAKKMRALLEMGFEIGNHTVSHRNLRRLSDTEVQQELATCVALIQQMAPKAKVDTMALPEGLAPRHRSLLASGSYNGQDYTNRAVMLVGANPALSPTSPKFDPLRLPRIQALEGNYGITFWLDKLKKNPKTRYVSDGNPETVTIPRSLITKVDLKRLNGTGLQVY